MHFVGKPCYSNRDEHKKPTTITNELIVFCRFIPMFRRDPMVDVDNGGLPPKNFEEVHRAIARLKESAQRDMYVLVARMDEDFYDLSRKEQILMLLTNTEGLKVTQTSIADVMEVSNGLVTRIKRYYEDHPDEVFKMRGRPSKITAVFDKVVKFIDDELKEGRSVTLGVLKEFMADTLHVHVRRKVLWQYMKNHDYTFVSGSRQKTPDWR